MVQFIEVVLPNDKTYRIAIQMIIGIGDWDGKDPKIGSEVETMDGKYYHLKESPEEILAKIEAVQREALDKTMTRIAAVASLAIEEVKK